MFIESIYISLHSIWSNKLRSFLTTLGIIIGVAAVIAVVALVQGLDNFMSEQFKSVGANYLRIMPDYRHMETNLNRVELTYEDAVALKKEVKYITKLSPLIAASAKAKYKDENYNKSILGTTGDFQDVVAMYVEFGRFINDIDSKHRKKVCVVGTEIVEDLFKGNDPIGKEIKLNNEAFTVVGVMEKKGEFLGANQDDYILIPFETALILLGKNFGKRIIIDCKIDSTENMEAAKDLITQVLRRKHSLKTDDGNDFKVLLQEEMVDMVSNILSMVTAIVAGIVSISLVVGGIGIMNIMLVSVTERTREIGIRKAVGARKQDILLQFLIEAVVLSIIGGAIGIFSGYWIGVLSAKAIPNFPPAHVPLWAVILGVGVSAFVGIVSGVFPAARAASQDPIDALRYE